MISAWVLPEATISCNRARNLVSSGLYHPAARLSTLLGNFQRLAGQLMYRPASHFGLQTICCNSHASCLYITSGRSLTSFSAASSAASSYSQPDPERRQHKYYPSCHHLPRAFPDTPSDGLPEKRWSPRSSKSSIVGYCPSNPGGISSHKV